MAEELAAAGIHTIDLGKGAKRPYRETLKSHDIFRAEGIVTSRSVLKPRTASAALPPSQPAAPSASTRASTMPPIRFSAAAALPAGFTAGF